MKTILYLFVLALFIELNLFSQTKNENSDVNEKDFSKYEVSCYCEIAGKSPAGILKLDNNGDIVLQLLEGKTEKEITVDYKQSQLELLKDFRLITNEDGKWKTSFPVLGESNTLKLRDDAKQIPPKLDPFIRSEILELIALLKESDREKNMYTIFFSYVLDDLVWRKFAELGYLQKREISAEKPFWSGVVWAVYPPREFSCGTNTVSDKGISLSVNWTEKAIKNMLPFVSDWKNLLKMFDDLVEKGKAEQKDARDVFDKFNLYDKTGEFTVPVITESENDRLYKSCISISDKVCKNIFSFIDVNKITNEFGFNSNEDALVIFYHELMWEMLDFYEKENVIAKPVAFSNPDVSSPADISDLVFIVKYNP